MAKKKLKLHIKLKKIHVKVLIGIVTLYVMGFILSGDAVSGIHVFLFPFMVFVVTFWLGYILCKIMMENIDFKIEVRK